MADKQVATKASLLADNTEQADDKPISAFGMTTEKEIVGKIMSDFRESFSNMQKRHVEMKEADDFYLSQQWKGNRADWKFNPVANYVAYIIDTKVPQITNSLPQPLILPTAKDDEEAAKLFTMVAGVITDRIDFQRKTEEVVQTGMLLGIGWYKVYWDNAIKNGSKKKGNVSVGDICMEVVDPVNVYPDTNATTVEDCRYIMYVTPKRLDWFKDTFPNTGQDVQEERNGYKTEIYDRGNSNRSMKGRALLYEYWYKEDGKLNVIYAAGGKVLNQLTDVYKHGRYPFIPFVPKSERKSIFGISEVKHMVENQKLLNKLLEIESTNALLGAAPVTLISNDSGINVQTFGFTPGLKQPVKDVNTAIRIIEPPKTTADVPRLIETLTGFMEKMGGVFDSATGETPGAVTAAAAIQLLQEQASIPIKGIQRSLFATVKDVYEHVIELVKEFYTETRYFRIDGDDGQIEFKEFSAAQHADIDLDVRISANAGTPTSKAFIAQMANDLFKEHLLTGSEYVDMLDGIPNKDKIVERLKQEESAPPPAPVPQQAPIGPSGPQQPPMGQQPQQPMDPNMAPPQPQQAGGDATSHLQAIMSAPDTPPQIKQMITSLGQQGASPDAIMQQVLQSSGQL